MRQQLYSTTHLTTNTHIMADVSENKPAEQVAEQQPQVASNGPETTAEKVVETPAEKPAETTTEKPTETPAEKSAEAAPAADAVKAEFANAAKAAGIESSAFA